MLMSQEPARYATKARDAGRQAGSVGEDQLPPVTDRVRKGSPWVVDGPHETMVQHHTERQVEAARHVATAQTLTRLRRPSQESLSKTGVDDGILVVG